VNLGRILIVDDEPQILRVLRTSLLANGYEVRSASNGEEALDLFGHMHPDLVITDLAMPRMSGTELCSALREISAVPIIVLSVRGEGPSKIEALDRGADDYVVKPFSIQELLARVRANLRRTRMASEKAAEVVSVGDFVIDPEMHRATVCGREVRLTPKEFDLLHYLALHPNKAIPHQALLNAVWGGQTPQTVDYLRVFINTLRKKVQAKYIVTEPWVGYRFVPTGAESMGTEQG
jgi:two-component system, OmpR family, KDP operon response regulator KdpE